MWFQYRIICVFFYFHLDYIVLVGSPYAVRPLSVFLSVCLSVFSVLSVYDVVVLWPNGWMDQDDTWHAGRPRI